MFIINYRRVWQFRNESNNTKIIHNKQTVTIVDLNIVTENERTNQIFAEMGIKQSFQFI